MYEAHVGGFTMRHPEVPEDLGEAWTTVIGSDPAADYPDGATPGDVLTLEDRSLLILRRD